MVLKRKKKGWAEPNLFRAQRAVSTLVKRAHQPSAPDSDNEDSSGNSASEQTRHVNKARSRKEARREARRLKRGFVRKAMTREEIARIEKEKKSKERLKEKKRLKKERQRQRKKLEEQERAQGKRRNQQRRKSGGLNEDESDAEPSGDEWHESDNDNDIPASKKAKKGSSDDHGSSAMIRRLQAAGLIDGGDPSASIDEDEKMIRDMERKLGTRNSDAASIFAKEDPLGDLFTFADGIVHGDTGESKAGEKNKAGRKKSKKKSSSGEEDTDDESVEPFLDTNLDSEDDGGEYDDDDDDDDAINDDVDDIDLDSLDDELKEELALMEEERHGQHPSHIAPNRHQGHDDGDHDEGDGDDLEWKIHKQLFGLSNKDKASFQESKEKNGGSVQPGKYVPPALRKRMEAEASKSKRDAQNSSTKAENPLDMGALPPSLVRTVRGTLNKLSDRNMSSIIATFVDIFGSNSRHNTTMAITKFVLDACVNPDRTLSHLLQVYAAFLACIHSTIGFEVSAAFLQTAVEQFHTLYKKTQEDLKRIKQSEHTPAAEIEAVLDKKAVNIMTLVSLLYCFNVVDATFIYDCLRSMVKALSPLDIELILEILKTCGPKLRHERDKKVLVIISEIREKAASLPHQTPRVKFMIETLLDVHSGRWRLLKDNSSVLKPLTMAVRSCLKTQHTSARAPLQVSLDDILNATTRGRWWLVGAAWAGRSGNSVVPGERLSLTRENSSGAVSLKRRKDKSSSELDELLMQKTLATKNEAQQVLELASQQRMNTELRRRVFSIIVTADDYVDAVEKLVKLNLRGQQEREIVRVAVDCCLQEVPFNRYYAVLIHNLCINSHSHKHTLKYVLWDRLREMATSPGDVRNNLMLLLAHVIANGSQSLSVLKPLEFSSLSTEEVPAVELLFFTLLTRYSEGKVRTAFERLQQNDAADPVKHGINIFLSTYMKAYLKQGTKQERKTLRTRMDLATRACTHAVL